MGAVYLAEHPDIGRRVAVKVLRPELIKDPQLLLRFLNEARAANAIRHPNIIEILDSGTTPEGTPYLVMELLEGEVLSARIQRVGKLSLVDTLEFSYQAASALAAAHNKGIIHRDLKPDNLFIIPDPSDPAREKIKVLDFGIAKLQTFPTGGGMQTRTGTLMGTPVYMSPEQCLGTKSVDQRSDIYAMGIIMFEMLAGSPPFLSEGFGELVNMHLNVRPRSLSEIDPTIPEPVAALVGKALEKAPSARQNSAAELQMEIRAAAGKAIVIRGVSSPDLATLPGAGTAATRAFGAATTMSTGTGELHSNRMFVKGKSRARGVLAGGAILVVGLAVVAAAILRRDAGKGTPNTLTSPAMMVAVDGVPVDNHAVARSEAAVSLVRLTIDSQPGGAEITDVESGRALGVAPVVVQRPPSRASLTVRVEKPGFRPVTRTFDVDRIRTETVSLEPAPTPAASMPTSRVPAEPPSSTRKRPPRPRHPTARSVDEPAKL